MHALRLIGVCCSLLGLFACGGSSVPAPPIPCTPPTGCVRVDQAGCACLEWTTISVETVPLKYLVVAIAYPALGTSSSVTYGTFDWPSSGLPRSASQFGSRWRTVIRAADGTERIARLGEVDAGSGQPFWKLSAVTRESIALTVGPGKGLGMSNQRDAYSRESDTFHVWLNPVVLVSTNFIGEKAVNWSSGGLQPEVFHFDAGEIDGSSEVTNPHVKEILDRFDAKDRAAILALDPFYAIPSFDPSTLASDPRFESMGWGSFHPGDAFSSDGRSWTPCEGALVDGNFPILDQAEIPFGSAETLVLQRSVVSDRAVCAPQRPGFFLGTTTPGCALAFPIFVDRMFGTLLMLQPATGLPPSCTTL